MILCIENTYKGVCTHMYTCICYGLYTVCTPELWDQLRLPILPDDQAVALRCGYQDQGQNWRRAQWLGARCGGAPVGRVQRLPLEDAGWRWSACTNGFGLLCDQGIVLWPAVASGRVQWLLEQWARSDHVAPLSRGVLFFAILALRRTSEWGSCCRII